MKGILTEDVFRIATQAGPVPDKENQGVLNFWFVLVYRIYFIQFLKS